MQTTSRKTDTKSKKESKDELTKKQDEKPKRSVYTISTPRDFVQKSSTADIYAQKKKINAQNAKAPKKAGTSNITNISPMKGLLKSSASSVSQMSEKTPAKRMEAKASLHSARKNETPRKQPTLTSDTVNSPSVKRKLNLNSERVTTKEMGSRKNERFSEKLNLNSERDSTKEMGSSKHEKINDSKKSKESFEVGKTKEFRKESLKESAAVKGERQRTKTRTLDENEVKILTPDVVDNNAGMMNLSQKLAAKPKAFYVDLDVEKPQIQPKKDKSSDEEISYEDDFESYESDFDSYHSEQTGADESDESEKSEASEHSERNEEMASVDDSSLKEKDEEKMLDSGNFDLRDQRSAKSKPAVMDFILEAGEDRKPVSLTDEGFQDMSSSSTASSMRTQQADRPLFMDFSKSKQNKLKRKIHDRLQQRAKDLLGMINLHEMHYSLFEMPPISYDLYMATFGRSNYTQTGVQTFDDGITEEVQTDEVAVCQKWTQYPVEFSKNDIYVDSNNMARKYSKHTEDYLTKFTFLMKESSYEHTDSNILDEKYLENPLRIFLEQKDGAGGDEMLPYETYKSKLKSNDYNLNKLGKFLKKYESKISNVLSSNVSHKDHKVTNLSKSNKIPFSKGFLSLSSKTINEEKLPFVKSSKISRVIFSETKPNLILTVHKNTQNVHGKKSLICLWDLSAARMEPVKVLTAIDNVLIGRFRGNIDGVLVAALDDGSIHLWDLTEEPTWHTDIANETKPTELVDIDSERLTDFEKDREWNLKNSHNMGFDQARIAMALQSCAFTSSASNMTTKEEIDRIVGLEMNTDAGGLETGRRIVGQISSLQRMGILTIWSIIQEKLKSCKDMGKAFLSKMRLEKNQTINLTDHISISIKHNINNEYLASFNLNAAKRRLSLRKKEKCIVKNQNSRPQSAISSKYSFDIDRPSSAASMRKRVLPVEINVPKNWETGVVCNDLKIIRVNSIDNYLVAKNCGEVLCCKRCLGAVKVERFIVATDTSSVTNVEVSSKALPYFLAATDTGTVNLCSLLDNRVLLTLDCRNVASPLNSQDKCLSDSKGRFISSVTSQRSSEMIEKPLAKLEIKSVHWSPVNPCSIYVLLQDCTVVFFELTHSDIYAKYVCEKAAVQCAANDFNLALLTPEGEVQAHRLTNELQTKENLNIFEKYVALL